LARKKTAKKRKKAPKKVKAPPKKEALPEAPKKIEITPELRRIWFRARNAWNMSLDAFSNALTLLTDKQAGQLYDVVRHSLFKDSYVEILREHPELHELVRNDEDRLFMHDVYEKLSWRLGKSEPLPKDVETAMKMKGGIGRAATRTSYW
jgi:hypothetical protein